MNIYYEMVSTGVKIHSHESDLYVPVTPETEAIVNRYQFKRNVTRFVNNLDGKTWFDIPFAYEPFWAKRFR